MDYVNVTREAHVATIRLERGKVNALNSDVVRELITSLDEAAQHPDIKAVVLTGTGKFFSFGFDIPEFLSYSRERFTEFLVSFTGLYTDLFLFPKPVIAALNGHTVAGGCMLATACDYRIMVDGRGRTSVP